MLNIASININHVYRCETNVIKRKPNKLEPSKRVLKLVADALREHGTLNHKEIAEYTGLNKHYASVATNWLKKIGLVTKEKRHTDGNKVGWPQQYSTLIEV